RVLAAGAGESCRLHRADCRATESHAGSHHAIGIRALRAVLPEGATETRLPVGWPVPARRRVLHISRQTRGLATRSVAHLRYSPASCSRAAFVESCRYEEDSWPSFAGCRTRTTSPGAPPKNTCK